MEIFLGIIISLIIIFIMYSLLKIWENADISILNFIINNGLGKLTGRMGNSGYCSYPEVEFFLDKI